MKRCGPSCRHTRNASAVFKIFVLHPKKTFATISAQNGHVILQYSRRRAVIDLFKPDHTMVANSRGQHTLKEILSVWRRRSARPRGSDYTHRSATIGGTAKRYRPDHRDDRLEMTKAP